MRQFILLAGLMIFLSQPAAACEMDAASYPECSDAEAINDALDDAGLDTDFAPKCGKPVAYPYENGAAEVFLVRYGRGHDQHCSYDKDAQVMHLPDGTYRAFHPEYFDLRRLNDYLETQLNTPFSYFNSYPYIGAKDYVTASVSKKGAAFCLRYDLKYPFQGHVDRCDEGDAATLPDFKGDVAYVPGVLTWAEAEVKYVPACLRHEHLENLNCRLSYNGLVPDRESPLGHWGSNSDPTMMFLKDGKLDFYLFINGTYELHDPQNRPGKIAVKVFADGRVQSRPVTGAEMPNFKKDVLKIGEEDFSATTPKESLMTKPEAESVEFH